jgi:hypothetical protein
MAEEQWIEKEIEKLKDRGRSVPSPVVDLLSQKLRTGLYINALTTAEQTNLAKDLLNALRLPEVTNAD